MTEEEKIRILLHEYSTLRQEIIARCTHAYQLLSVGLVILAWFMTMPKDVGFWAALAVAVSIAGCATWVILRGIKKAAFRLRELEGDINRRAGEDLLKWESRYGGDVAGYIGLGKPKQPSASHASDS